MTTYFLRNGELVEKGYAENPIRGVHIIGDLPAYKSPLGNGWIDGRAARREELKRSGCREVDPSEFKASFNNARFAQKYRLPHTPGSNPNQYAPRERADYDLSHLKR